MNHIKEFRGFYVKEGRNTVRFKYINQLKISGFSDDRSLRLLVESVMAAKRTHFSIQFLADPNRSVSRCTLLTLKDNMLAKWAIQVFDGHQCAGEVLICRPHGFMNLRYPDKNRCSDFTNQQPAVMEFNASLEAHIRSSVPSLMDVRLVLTHQLPREKKKTAAVVLE